MTTNLFDYFEELAPDDDTQAPWAARVARRPRADHDLALFARTPDWRDDDASLDALRQIEREPWVERVERPSAGDCVSARLTDGWIEATGATLEAGGRAEAQLTDLARARRVSMQFWDANATKALHVGHLRNLAIGNGLAAALAQAGAQVERRSRISDLGRAMGEAMAGVVASGRDAAGFFDVDGKSDHFVGECYAEYVAAAGVAVVDGTDQAEDSLAREVHVQDDAADELIKRVLAGERNALELWYKTRAWVIAGQRKTLGRLGIAFDRVLFESDFLRETNELAERGLREGTLRRRDDGVVVYETGLRELDELPLVRADGLSTQHMRSLTYALSAPELDGMTSMQVTGAEWVAHLACIRKLADELEPDLNGGFHPSRSIFHGMVSSDDRAVTSSAGGLLIDELVERVDEQLDADRARRDVRRAHRSPENLAAQIVLGYFLPHPATPDIEFAPDRLLRDGESLGWDLARAQARGAGAGASATGRPAEDRAYRFAVVQSELYRRHLRQAVERLDLRPVALYLRHLARWHLEGEHGEHVTRVVQTLLDRCARGLGLEAMR
jgi:arginyl-tRNA synthetase